VSTISAPAIGLDGFVAGLDAQGIGAARRGDLLVYSVAPLVGARAGTPVETGVEASELSGWPTVPPHWIHVPTDLNIPGSQPSALAGWSRYSRPHPGRIDAASNPANSWIAHVREFLGHAA
jgi:hypothetical protein